MHHKPWYVLNLMFFLYFYPQLRYLLLTIELIKVLYNINSLQNRGQLEKKYIVVIKPNSSKISSYFWISLSYCKLKVLSQVMPKQSPWQRPLRLLAGLYSSKVKINMPIVHLCCIFVYSASILEAVEAVRSLVGFKSENGYLHWVWTPEIQVYRYIICLKSSYA